MSTILDLSTEILNEKTEKIIPENIKKGVKIFDIEGALEAGAAVEGVKLFSSIEEMNADATVEAGDLAIVYKHEVQDAKSDSIFTKIDFPTKVILSKATTSSADAYIMDDTQSYETQCQVRLSPTYFYILSYRTYEEIVRYESTDGTTYTKVSGENSYSFEQNMHFNGTWNDAYGKFIQIGASVFNGLFNAIEINDISKPYLLDLSKSTLPYNNLNLVYSEVPFNYVPDMKYYVIIATDANNFTIYKSNTDTFQIGTNSTDTVRFLNLITPGWSNNYDTYKEVYVNGTLQESTHYTPNTNTFIDVTPNATYNKLVCYLDNQLIYICTDDEHIHNFKTTDTVIPWSQPNYEETKISWTYAPKIIYESAPTQLSATNDMVYNSIFYGKNGVEEGSLGIPNTDFTDNNAQVYFNIQKAYDSMTPRVLTNNNYNIDQDTIFIPTKTDGTPLIDTSGLTDAHNLFYGCAKLETIPLIDLSKATIIYQLFYGCTNLKTIPLINISKATDLSSMFFRCSSLMSVPALDTSSAEDMQFMFQQCPELVDIPVLNTSKVTSIHSAFSGCSKLSDQTLNNIMQMCINSKHTTKTLYSLGISSEQATRCQSLSNYSAFTAAGWTTGY